MLFRKKETLAFVTEEELADIRLRITQLECPHKDLEYTSPYYSIRYSEVCRNCKKTLRKFSSLAAMEKAQLATYEAEVERLKKGMRGQ